MLLSDEKIHLDFLWYEKPYFNVLYKRSGCFAMATHSNTLSNKTFLSWLKKMAKHIMPLLYDSSLSNFKANYDKWKLSFEYEVYSDLPIKMAPILQMSQSRSFFAQILFVRKTDTFFHMQSRSSFTENSAMTFPISCPLFLGKFLAAEIRKNFCSKSSKFWDKISRVISCVQSYFLLGQPCETN